MLRQKVCLFRGKPAIREGCVGPSTNRLFAQLAGQSMRQASIGVAHVRYTSRMSKYTLFGLLALFFTGTCERNDMDWCRPPSGTVDAWPCCDQGRRNHHVPSVSRAGMFVVRAVKGYARAARVEKGCTFRDCRSRSVSPRSRVFGVRGLAGSLCVCR